MPDEGVLVTRGVVVRDVKSSCVGRVVVAGMGMRLVKKVHWMKRSKLATAAQLHVARQSCLSHGACSPCIQGAVVGFGPGKGASSKRSPQNGRGARPLQRWQRESNAGKLQAMQAYPSAVCVQRECMRGGVWFVSLAVPFLIPLFAGSKSRGSCHQHLITHSLPPPPLPRLVPLHATASNRPHSLIHTPPQDAKPCFVGREAAGRRPGRAPLPPTQPLPCAASLSFAP